VKCDRNVRAVVLLHVCLTQVRDLSVGDTVKILNDEEAVRALQNGHGGWNNQMKNVYISELILRFVNVSIYCQSRRHEAYIGLSVE